MLLPPPRSTLFPYTTLFRSAVAGRNKWLLELRIKRGLPNTVLDDAERTVSSTSESVGIERSEEHTSELQSHSDLVCRLLLEKKKKKRQKKLNNKRMTENE